MNFLTPTFLIALPLIGVPLVIHLLSKRQQKKISWGAMRFLLQAATRRRRLWRLTDILLLLLRTAAFLFFIFALARPLLSTTWLGGSIPREIILVLDQSMSMSRKIDGRSMFDRQLEKAAEVLAELKASDTIRVLLAGESPEWLTTEARPVNGNTLRKLRTEINELKPTLGAADLIACVREAADLEAPKDKSARVIVVITDGQRFGWRMDERPLWAAVQERIQQSLIPTSVSLRLLKAERPAANISINGLKTFRALGAIEQGLTFAATVQNHSAAPSVATLLTWRIGDNSIGATTVPELGPGESTSLSLNHPFPAAGSFDVGCYLESTDDLAADNEAHLLVDIYERLPVLVVEDRTPDEPGDTPFIMAALGARQTQTGDKVWHSVFEPTVIDSAALASTDLAQFRAVVLANVGAMPAGITQKIEAYARNGGGVWLALGGRTDDQTFNSTFYRGGLGLSPAKINGAIGDPNDREKFFSVRAASDAHPATALLADFQRLDLDRARIYRRHQFDHLSGKDVSVLLQAQDGEPVVIERKLERGRVIVQGIPLGVAWSTLPLCQAYVAMLHEWLWYLSEPSLPRRNLSVGEAIIQPSSKSDTAAEVASPDGAKHELQAALVAGTPQFRYNGTRLPGDYSLQVKGGSAARTAAAKFYVHRNPDESNLQALTEKDQQQLASTKAFRLNTDSDSALQADSAGTLQPPKHPLEGTLLVALAFVLLSELALAGWTTNRRNLRVQPVAMDA